LQFKKKKNELLIYCTLYWSNVFAWENGDRLQFSSSWNIIEINCEVHTNIQEGEWKEERFNC